MSFIKVPFVSYLAFIQCFVFLICVNSHVANADIFKWVGEDGKLNFSDSPPVTVSFDKVVLKPSNSLSNEGTLDNKQYSIPYRFVLTSDISKENEPVDNLDEINISKRQKSFYTYTSLTSIKRKQAYTIRIKISDAKGVLIFDNTDTQTSSTNSICFVTKVSPKLAIDTPGEWLVEAILDDKKLFTKIIVVRF